MKTDMESKKIYSKQIFFKYADGNVRQRQEIGNAGIHQNAVHKQLYILKWTLIVVAEITFHLHSIPYRILQGLPAQGEESGFTKAVWDCSRDTEITFSARGEDLEMEHARFIGAP